MEFHIRFHLKLLLCSVTATMLLKVSQSPKKATTKKGIHVLSPVHQQTVILGLHKQDDKHKNNKHANSFWQSMNKSDKKHIL